MEQLSSDGGLSTGLKGTLKRYADIASFRNEAIILSCASGAYRMKEIGDFFGRHYSRVSRIPREAKGKT